MRRLLRWAKEAWHAWHHGHLAVVTLQAVGLWNWVVSLAAAAVTAGLALLTAMPAYGIVLVFFAALFLCAGAFALGKSGVNARAQRNLGSTEHASSVKPRNEVASPALPVVADPAGTTLAPRTYDPNRARLRIGGVFLSHSAEGGFNLIFELKNAGGMRATGIVHQAWIEADPALTRPDTVQPRDEGERAFLEPDELLTIERPVLEDYVERPFHPYLHFGGGSQPPLASRQQWAWLLYTPFVFGIRAVYWDGDHTRRLAECRYSFNPDNGSIGRLYEQEDVRLDGASPG